MKIPDQVVREALYLLEEGFTPTEVGAKLDIHPQSVIDWMKGISRVRLLQERLDATELTHDEWRQFLTAAVRQRSSSGVIRLEQIKAPTKRSPSLEVGEMRHGASP